MKNMTFNFAVAIVLVVEIIRFMTGAFAGLIETILEYNLDKFEENSFLKKVYSWLSNWSLLCSVSLAIIADVISVFVLSFIF